MGAKRPDGTRCYPARRGPLELLGYALIAVGAVLLFCCIPCWAWVALIGVALVAAGVLLLSLSPSGR